MLELKFTYNHKYAHTYLHCICKKLVWNAKHKLEFSCWMKFITYIQTSPRENIKSKENSTSSQSMTMIYMWVSVRRQFIVSYKLKKIFRESKNTNLTLYFQITIYIFWNSVYFLDDLRKWISSFLVLKNRILGLIVHYSALWTKYP